MASKFKHHLYFCWNNVQSIVKNFIEHGKSLSVVKLCIDIKMEIQKYMCYQDLVTKSVSFRDFSKLHAIALKSSRSYPQHLEINWVPFSHKIFFIYSCTQSCNGNKVTPCASCWTYHYKLRQNGMIVSLSYLYMMQLSLFKGYFYIT